MGLDSHTFNQFYSFLFYSLSDCFKAVCYTDHKVMRYPITDSHLLNRYFMDLRYWMYALTTYRYFIFHDDYRISGLPCCYSFFTPI